MKSTRRLRLVAVVLLGGVASGCGVGAQERPVPIDRKDVPFGLLREAPNSTTSTTSTPRNGPTAGDP